MTETLDNPIRTHTSSELWPELWVSLASLLRSYTAAHGLNHKQQATVELGKEHMIVRAGTRWLSLTRQQSDIKWSREDGATGEMRFTVRGTIEIRVGVLEMQNTEEEMDMQAEAWARELMQ